MIKKVIVSGGSRGLGLEICKVLSLNGYHPIILSRKKPNLSINFSFYEIDLCDTEKIPDLVKNIKNNEGEVYGLVNNAAIGKDGILSTMHDSEITETINLNVTSMILLTKYVSKLFLLQGYGKIVNISSIIAQTGFSGMSVYAASKSAVTGFTKSLARELGKLDITVNAILPGYMETEMTSQILPENLKKIINRSPNKKLTKTNDVAELVSYLLSEKSNSINGACYVIDNGSSI